MIKGYSVLTGKPLSDKNLVIERRFKGYQHPFNLYRCPESQVVQTIPMPDMEELIRKEYRDDYMAYQDVDLKKNRSSANRDLKKIERYISEHNPKKILDIGCSTGWFLKVAQEKGYEISGIELSAYAANKAKVLLGDVVFIGKLEDSEFQCDSFDIIYSNMVIEHIPDSIAFMKKIYFYLKKGGILAINTPNMDSLAWKKLRGNWTTLQKPDHLVFYNRYSIKYLLEHFSFEVLAIHTKGMPPIMGKSKPSVDQNLNKTNKSLDQNKNWLEMLKHWILKHPIISNSSAALIDFFRLGDAIFVISQKKI